MKKQFFRFFRFFRVSAKRLFRNKTGKTEKKWENCFLRRSWGVYLVCEKAVFPVFSVFPSIFQKIVSKQNWKNWKNCFLRRSWGVYLVCEKAIFPVFPNVFQKDYSEIKLEKLKKNGKKLLSQQKLGCLPSL